MNFILYLLIATYFCLLEVKCRSVQLDSDFHSILQDGGNKDLNHDPESNGRFSWKRLKPILHREMQWIRNVKGETTKVNDESAENASSVPAKEDDESIGVDKTEEISLKAELQIKNTSLIKSALNKHTQNEEPVSESNVPEEFSTNFTHLETLQLDHPSSENDFTNNIISDILNKSSDSILLQVLNDNSSKIDFLEFDETSLLSEGSHVATLQEVSPVSIELLIDSETKQNSILAELLSSQSNLIDDDDFNTSTDDDLSFVTMQFNDGNGSVMQEVVTNGESTGNPDIIQLDEVEARTENTEFHLNDASGAKSTEFHLNDASGAKSTEFHLNDAAGAENIEFHLDGEAGTENTQFHTNEAGTGNTEFHRGDEAGTGNTELSVDAEAGTENTEFLIDDEIETEGIEFGSNIIENIENNAGEMKNDTVAENRTTETDGPKCPDPGWCIFWFLALDTCAKDSHCDGSLLCCMLGCSKTCIDPDNEFHWN